MTEEEIKAKLDEEIEHHAQLQRQHDSGAFALQAQYDKADKKAWKRKGGPTDEEVKELDSLHQKLMRCIDGGIAEALKLEELRSTHLLERRLREADRKEESKVRMKESLAASKQRQAEHLARPAALRGKKVTAKEQGFPDVYLAENGNFKPGWDTKAKGDLVSSALGQTREGQLHKFTKKEAEELLAKRDWTRYLDKKKGKQ